MRELHGTSGTSARSGSGARILQGKDQVETQGEDEVVDEDGVRERSRDLESGEGARPQRQPVRELVEEAERARPRHRQRQPTEFLSRYAEDREASARGRLDRSEGLQQDRRQHVSEPDGDSHRSDAATGVLAMQTDGGLQARQLPFPLAQFPQRRLRHGLRRGRDCPQHIQLPQGRLRRAAHGLLSETVHAGQRETSQG